MKKKKAHWIKKTHLFRRDEYVCSACGSRAERPHPVCPVCASPMKGTKTDPVWVEEMADYDEIFGD